MTRSDTMRGHGCDSRAQYRRSLGLRALMRARKVLNMPSVQMVDRCWTSPLERSQYLASKLCCGVLLLGKCGVHVFMQPKRKLANAASADGRTRLHRRELVHQPAEI